MGAETMKSLGTVGAGAEQPTPPAPPPPPDIERVGAMARAAAAQVEAELAQAGITPPGTEGEHAGHPVERDGKVVITGRDDQTIVLDVGSVPQEKIDAYVSQALAPEPPYVDRGPPDGVVLLVGTVFGFLTLMVVGFPLTRAWARRLDRRPVAPAPVDGDVSARLERIEQAVESIAIEVERVSEAQRFSSRLLSERLPEALPLLDARAGGAAGAVQGASRTNGQ